MICCRIHVLTLSGDENRGDGGSSSTQDGCWGGKWSPRQSPASLLSLRLSPTKGHAGPLIRTEFDPHHKSHVETPAPRVMKFGGGVLGGYSGLDRFRG